MLDRWWGIATIRAHPLTEEEQELVRRIVSGGHTGRCPGPGSVTEVAGDVLSWVDVAPEQYAGLRSEVQHLIDLRLADLLEEPGDRRCSEDAASGQSETTDNRLGLTRFSGLPERGR